MVYRQDALSGGFEHGVLDLGQGFVGVRHSPLQVQALAGEDDFVGLEGADHIGGSGAHQGQVVFPEGSAGADDFPAGYVRQFYQHFDRAGDHGEFPAVFQGFHHGHRGGTGVYDDVFSILDQAGHQGRDFLFGFHVPFLAHVEGHLHAGVLVQHGAAVALDGKALPVQLVQVAPDGLLGDVKQGAQLADHHFSFFLQFFQNQVSALYRQHTPSPSVNLLSFLVVQTLEI